MKPRSVKQADVSKFITEHPSFSNIIEIPDTHILNFFNPTGMQLITIKSKFYTYFRISLDFLIDEMDKGFEYNQALRIIKAHGFGLPIRIANWGYKEPITVDELLDKLDKNSKHWQRVYENSIEREQIVERKKVITQKTLTEE